MQLESWQDVEKFLLDPQSITSVVPEFKQYAVGDAGTRFEAGLGEVLGVDAGDKVEGAVVGQEFRAVLNHTFSLKDTRLTERYL